MIRIMTLIAILTLAGAAAAQINHPYNEVGIYAVPDPDGCATAQAEVAAMGQVTCYLVLSAPYNEVRGRPVTTVGGVECRYVLSDGVVLLGGLYPPSASPPCFPGPGELLFACAAPVVDGRCVLYTMTLLSLDGQPGFIHLIPFNPFPSIPDRMAFTDHDDDYEYGVQAMHPVSGSHDLPVFAINWDGDLSFCETVPARDASFGGVKALYR